MIPEATGLREGFCKQLARGQLMTVSIGAMAAGSLKVARFILSVTR